MQTRMWSQPSSSRTFYVLQQVLRTNDKELDRLQRLQEPSVLCPLSSDAVPGLGHWIWQRPGESAFMTSFPSISRPLPLHSSASRCSSIWIFLNGQMPTRTVTASQNISEDRNIKWPGGVCRSVPSITPYTGLEWWTTASRHVTGRWDLGGKWFGKCWMYLGLCKHAGPEFLFFSFFIDLLISQHNKNKAFFFFLAPCGLLC